MSELVMLQLKRVIKAKRARVFEAWTKPELLRQWFGPAKVSVRAAKIDLREGGAYRIDAMNEDGTGHAVAGIYKKIVPGEMLSFTWGWVDHTWDSLVTVTLKDVEGGTEVTILHERLPSAEIRQRHEHGWSGSLDKLAALLQ